MSENKSGSAAIKAGIWYTVSSFMLKAIAFLTTPVFTRLLTQEEYGNYSNFLSWLSILTFITTLNMSSTLIRARYDFEDDFKDYIFSIMILGSVATLICYGIVLFKVDYFSELFSMGKIYIHIMFLSLLVSSAIDIFQIVQRIEYKYKANVFLSIGSMLATIGVSLLLVFFLPDKLFGRVIGSQLPLFCINVWLYIYYGSKCRRIRLEYWKYALIICLPYLPHLIAGNLLGTMDRVMIQRFCGAEYTALYSIAHQCAIIISTLLTSMNTAFSPWLGEKLHEKKYEEIKQASKGYIMLLIIPAIGLMLVSPEVLYILGGEAYLAAKYVMPPLTLGCVCQFLYTLYVNVEQFEKKTMGMAMATIVAAIINGILNYLLIPRFGYIAAAYTTLIGYVCLLGMHYMLVRRMGLAKIYDTRLVVLVIVIMTMATMVINVLYDFCMIRYVIILVYAVFVMILGWKNRQIIISKVMR